jgi:hypothetical protein
MIAGQAVVRAYNVLAQSMSRDDLLVRGPKDQDWTTEPPARAIAGWRLDWLFDAMVLMVTQEA